MLYNLIRAGKCVPFVTVALLLLATPGHSQQDGATLFKSKCAACHGPDGKGETAMGKALKIRNLGSPEVQSQSDAQLTEIVTKGKNKMPAFDGKLSKEQITALVAYVRDFGKKH
ncbi:MAG TPA: cytochrome c [Candidatus Methylomirabilis sp.]|nr:cytochrome c [Candidatus Methylomirabilis sp.]